MDKHKLAISTISLGWHSTHTLERKLQAAATHGFNGVEIFISDLTDYAQSSSMSTLEAADMVRKLCAMEDLHIVCLASFDDFEGSTQPLEERMEKARNWVALARALRTDIIQIPSNSEKDAVGDDRTIVNDLQALADLGIEGGISFAYEALAWGVHVADWEESLRIVELVNRPNFGLCLDTYHVLSRVWADGMSISGQRPGGTFALQASIWRFLNDCPLEKIIYVQLSDAERLTPPLLPGHPAYDARKDPTHSWCSYGRLFPLEEEKGAYLPIVELASAWLIEKRWTGWVSMEIFHRDMDEEIYGPGHWALRGQASWRKLKGLLT